MKNPLKRRKFDKIIKEDILVRVWDDDKSEALERYLFFVASKNENLDYPFSVWYDGKTKKELGYDTFLTSPFKNAELVEPEKEKPLFPEIQEFCDKYNVWCVMDPTGVWFWYKKKPHRFLSMDRWGVRPCEGFAIMPIQPKYKGDWTKTLHEPKETK
jgi:hypothetical protein